MNPWQFYDVERLQVTRCILKSIDRLDCCRSTSLHARVHGLTGHRRAGGHTLGRARAAAPEAQVGWRTGSSALRDARRVGKREGGAFGRRVPGMEKNRLDRLCVGVGALRPAPPCWNRVRLNSESPPNSGLFCLAGNPRCIRVS